MDVPRSKKCGWVARELFLPEKVHIKIFFKVGEGCVPTLYERHISDQINFLLGTKVLLSLLLVFCSYCETKVQFLMLFLMNKICSILRFIILSQCKGMTGDICFYI